MLKKLNTKDYTLITCVFAVMIILFFLRDKDTRPIAIKSSGITQVNNKRISNPVQDNTIGKLGEGTTVGGDINSIIGDSMLQRIDTFKDIKWIVEYIYSGRDSTPILTGPDIHDPYVIIHKGLSWYKYHPYLVYHNDITNGYIEDGRGIECFLNGKTLILVR